MIPVVIQRVHHFSTVGLAEMMNHVYLWELQSSPSHVASSTHSMLELVAPLYIFSYHNKGLHIIKLPFPCHPLSDQVSSVL